jgi:uncharacterized protein
MRFSRSFFFLVALVVTLIPAVGCAGDRRTGVTVKFSGEGIGQHEPYSMEVAATADARAKGLMFRRDMDAGHGMLFLFPREEPLSFWMKNTYLPLDIIFVGRDWRVVGVVENAVPLTEEPRGVPGISQRVIELNAGEARKVGVRAGTQVIVSGRLPEPF